MGIEAVLYSRPHFGLISPRGGFARAKIKEAKNVHDGKDAVGRILESFKVTITKQRELLELAAEAGDEGTNALMSDYIREQEKLVWMYSATLKK